MWGQSELVRLFEEGATIGGVSHLYISGDVMYSYGEHFPLVVRLDRGGYLVNGDKYSVTTSAHQSLVFRLGPQVPFSALRPALQHISPVPYWDYFVEDVRRVVVVEHREDVWSWVCQCGGEHTSEYHEGPLGKHVRCGKGYSRHTLGAALLHYGGRYLLSTMDATRKNGAYSLILLREEAQPGGVHDALMELMPQAVRELAEEEDSPREEEKEYKTVTTGWSYRKRPTVGHTYTRGLYPGGVRRQGEIWLIPQAVVPRGQDGQVIKHYVLPIGNESHVASKAQTVGTATFVSGQLKHLRGEHYVQQLGQGWWLALPNTAEKSWSAAGRVD